MISMLLALPLLAVAGENDKKETKDKSNIADMFSINGIGVSADIFGYVYSLIDDYTSGEVAVELNLGNRFYPIAEIGLGWCDAIDETTSIRYKTRAPYYRVGINYNFMTNEKKPNPKNYVYALARFGWSSFNYDVETPPVTDPVWGGSTALKLNDVKGSCSWAEFGVGVKVKIAKGFHMGWSIRYKTRISEKQGNNSRMWYIPGFGINKGTCFGGTYNLIYEIPFKK